MGDNQGDKTADAGEYSAYRYISMASPSAISPKLFFNKYAHG